MLRRLSIALSISLLSATAPAIAQTPPSAAAVTAQAPARPPNPVRDPHAPGYVAAKDLPDGAIPPPNVDGNFIVGPTHNPAPEMAVNPAVPKGDVYEFTMKSADSKFYPGIEREPNTFGTADPTNPAKMIVTTSHPAPYTRKVAIYVPKQYVPGTAAPLMVGADGIDRGWFTVLDNLIAEHRIPVMVAISISNGGGDAQGSERGLEYDTMSGRYAEFVETGSPPPRRKPRPTSSSPRTPTPAPPWEAAPEAPAPWPWPGITPSSTTVCSPTPAPSSTSNGPPTPRPRAAPGSSMPASSPTHPPNPLRIWMDVGDRDNLNPNHARQHA